MQQRIFVDVIKAMTLRRGYYLDYPGQPCLHNGSFQAAVVRGDATGEDALEKYNTVALRWREVT